MAIGLRIKFDGRHARSSTTRSTPRWTSKATRRTGLIFHSAGPIEDGWGIIDFWESREHFDRFQRAGSARRSPALGDAAPPRAARHQGVPGPQHHQALGADDGPQPRIDRSPRAPRGRPTAPAIRLGEAELTYGALDDAQRPPGDAAARRRASSRATGSG